VARDGADGVNLHSYPGLPNALFDFRRSAGGWTASVSPLYYGALLFARGAPAGSRLLSITARGPASLHAWATAGPGRVRRLVVVNESRSHASVLEIGGLGGRVAELQRLSAPSAAATSGITLGGRTFGAATATGRLAAPLDVALRARHGAYRLMVPAASALLLTVSGAGAAR
jgi:Glycosyl hydrolase family 79 C-terminal beta domain